MKEHLCKTCKNWFEIRIPRYYRNGSAALLGRLSDRTSGRYARNTNDDFINSFDELTDEQRRDTVIKYGRGFCVYTREEEKPVTCTFYNHRQELALTTEPPKKADTDDYDYQDVDRTFTTSERATSVRLDDRIRREGVPLE